MLSGGILVIGLMIYLRRKKEGYDVIGLQMSEVILLGYIYGEILESRLIEGMTDTWYRLSYILLLIYLIISAKVLSKEIEGVGKGVNIKRYAHMQRKKG